MSDWIEDDIAAWELKKMLEEDREPDTELLAHDVERSVDRYIAAAERDPEGHLKEWTNLADTYTKLGQFLVRSRARRVA